jgi:hypothetical protein
VWNLKERSGTSPSALSRPRQRTRAHSSEGEQALLGTNVLACDKLREEGW